MTLEMPADQFIDNIHGPPALAGVVSKKYTAGLEMLCPGGAASNWGRNPQLPLSEQVKCQLSVTWFTNHGGLASPDVTWAAQV